MRGDYIEINPILDAWITARDRMRARHNHVQDVSQKEFIDSLNGYANQLSFELDYMTIAQWEALVELAGTQLGLMRQRQALYKRG